MRADEREQTRSHLPLLITFTGRMDRMFSTSSSGSSWNVSGLGPRCWRPHTYLSLEALNEIGIVTLSGSMALC